jgi:LPXTG-motif cell wall-anchored protein
MQVQLRIGGEDVLLRAVRSSSALRASITFDRGAYAVGDTLRERVTLTNTGTTDLSGVTARCVEGAAPNQLSGLGWGDLVHYTAPGVTVRAGETRTFDFTDVVPAGGRLFGFVTITCWFSTAYKYDDGPVVVARAEVPGGVGSAGGHLYVDRNLNVSVEPGEGVPGVKVFLVADNGAVVGRAVTDALGHFWFVDVPANNYELRLSGPWRPLRNTAWRIGVFAGESMDAMQVQVIPGSIQPDLDPPPAPAPSPVPQATVRPSTLADTGASVEELTVLGLLLVLAGVALIAVRRPKKLRA